MCTHLRNRNLLLTNHLAMVSMPALPFSEYPIVGWALNFRFVVPRVSRHRHQRITAIESKYVFALVEGPPCKREFLYWKSSVFTWLGAAPVSTGKMLTTTTTVKSETNQNRRGAQPSHIAHNYYSLCDSPLTQLCEGSIQSWRHHIHFCYLCVQSRCSESIQTLNNIMGVSIIFQHAKYPTKSTFLLGNYLHTEAEQLRKEPRLG